MSAETNPFDPSQFKSTMTVSSQEKADSANRLIRFIESGFKWNLFSNKLYTFLNRSFGHTAHRNRAGFYDVWFATLHHQIQWILHIQSWNTSGRDPGSSNSDVEDALRSEIAARGYYEKLRIGFESSRKEDLREK